MRLSKLLCFFISVTNLITAIILASGSSGVKWLLDADWTYVFHAYLYIGHGHRWLSALIVGLCSLGGLAALLFSQMPLWLRYMLFMIQCVLLVFVTLWTVNAIFHARDAFGRHQSILGLLVNQLPRIVTPGLYVMAVIAVLQSDNDQS